MLIQIESGDAKAKRKVVVTGADGKELAKFTADNLAEAHKALKKGLKEGWSTLK